MKHTMVDSYILDESEKETLRKATEIMNEILVEMRDVPTYAIDDQVFDEEIGQLLTTAMKIEMHMIFSDFNSLTDEARTTIRMELNGKA